MFNLCSHTPSTDHRTFKSELDLIKSGSFDHELSCQVWCCSLIHSSSQLCHVRSIGTFHHTHHSRMVSHTCVYFACDYPSSISVNFGNHTHCRRTASHQRGFPNASAGWSYVCLNSGASFQLFLGGQKFFTFFNATGLLKNLKKNSTLVISRYSWFPFFPFFFSFFFFLFFSFFLFILGGRGRRPQAPSNDAPA